MRTIWTLTVKTSLPDTCETKDDLHTTAETFETFEKAKRRMREVIKELAFSENAMFDGGYMTNFSQYIDDHKEYEEEEDEEPSTWLTAAFLEKLHKVLHEVFSGRDEELPFPVGKYCDMFLCTDISSDGLLLQGYDDGPWNGINPFVKTNIFDMTEEKNYWLYIDDLFGGCWGQACSAELYVDLIKTELEI